MDDKTFLDNLQAKLGLEVNATKEELVQQARITEMVAKNFVAAQLKQNLFIALRVIAEKELETLKSGGQQLSPNIRENSIRQDDNDGEIAYPQVSNLIKAIFSNGKANLSNIVETVSHLESAPIGGQLVGVVSAIAGRPGQSFGNEFDLDPKGQKNSDTELNNSSYNSISAQFQATDLGDAKVQSQMQGQSDPDTNEPILSSVNNKPYQYSTVGSKGVAAPSATFKPNLLHQITNEETGVASISSTTTKKPDLTTATDSEDEDEDEDEDENTQREQRQFNLGNLLSNVFRTTKAIPITQATVTQKVIIQAGDQTQEVIVQTVPAPEVMAMPQGFNFQTFATNFGKNFGDIIKIMPDLFRGAREGVQLIQAISSVFGRLDEVGEIAGVLS